MFASEGLAPPAELGRAVGCPRCRGTGYRDRIGVLEAVAIEGPATEALLSGASEDELRKAIRSAGTPSLMADGLQKASEGITTIEEVQGDEIDLRGDPGSPFEPPDGGGISSLRDSLYRLRVPA